MYYSYTDLPIDNFAKLNMELNKHYVLYLPYKAVYFLICCEENLFT